MMIPDLIESEAKVMAALVLASALFAAGWAVEDWRMSAEISDLKAQQAESDRQVTALNTQRLVEGIRRGEALQTRVANNENQLEQLTQEKSRETQRLTTGRPCLGGAAVRVLNARTLPASTGAIPETASDPLSANDGFASDTDIGLWIGQAQRAYDACRGRLNAIADFYAAEEVTP
jgi:hypothetical protein